MERAILHPIDENKLVKISGKHYVSGAETGDLVLPDPVIPVYFARTSLGQVLPDDPVPGAESIGDVTTNSIGPFFSLQQAKRAINKRKKQADTIHYNFSSQILTCLIPQPDFPASGKIRVYRYNSQSYSCRLNSWRMNDEQRSPEHFREFVKIMLERLKEKSAQISKDGLRAIVGGCFLNVAFRIPIMNIDRLYYSVQSFGEKTNVLKDFTCSSLDYDKRRGLGLYPYGYLEERTFCEEHLSLTPITISLRDKDIASIIKKTMEPPHLTRCGL
ncbi:MAG: hypothetical protein NT076_02880 [Candidatus Pacearchaeota archaeon]|nr:hypothetical protein [Candidatus Pacearchaeota archaeon]